MNRELIEALEECQKAFDNLCGNSMMYKPLRVNIKKALQKAKEQPTKNAEEFLKSSKQLDWDKLLNTDKDVLCNLLESYSNQSKKTITEEEIEREADRRFQLIADLNTIEACYNVEFGDIEKAAEYIIAKGD